MSTRKQKPKTQPATSGGERLKTVVRRLPPNLPEAVFWQSVQDWVTDDTVVWKSYYPGKLRTRRMNKEGIPSRAYIAFKNEAQLATFSREYDGHLFRDKAGNESQAIVEFAPFQKIPTEKRKVDTRHNTIDKDDDYRSFLESLGSGKPESVPLDVLLVSSHAPPPTTTPLLEALKAEKQAQKDRDAILRHHVHYRDAAGLVGPSKKEDGKKPKGGLGTVAAKQEPASLSKKAKKAVAAAAVVPKQDGQAKPPAAPTNVKQAPPTPTAAVAGHGRHRSSKPPRKGDPSAPPAPAPAPVPVPPTASTETASGAAGQRKTRPVIGLGRQLEAALTGAGVAVSPGTGPALGSERRTRDKSGENVLGVTGAAENNTRGKQREDLAVPSILQRPEGSVVIMQRSQSPRIDAGRAGAVAGEGAGTGGTARRSSRKGRGHRGGGG